MTLYLFEKTNDEIFNYKDINIRKYVIFETKRIIIDYQFVIFDLNQ